MKEEKRTEAAERDSVYEKLTPQRKLIVDEVLKRLESGKGIWEQGWISTGRPQSAITGKKYRGNNNFLLTYVSMARGYTDNRWLTYKQMVDKGWEFKRDAEGKTLGKNAGVTIEYFELRDRTTREPFSKLSLLGMTEEEKQTYMDENVYPMRKYYPYAVRGTGGKTQSRKRYGRKRERTFCQFQIVNGKQKKKGYRKSDSRGSNARDGERQPKRFEQF